MATPEPNPHAIDRDELKRLASEVENADQQAAEYTTDKAEMLRGAKAKGLHGPAFALAVRLHKMPAHKRQTFLECFDEYREALALDFNAQLDIESAIRAQAEARA